MLVFQPVPHNEVSDCSKCHRKQYKNANYFGKIRLLILVHVIITVSCTIFGTVLNSNVSQ